MKHNSLKKYNHKIQEVKNKVNNMRLGLQRNRKIYLLGYNNGGKKISNLNEK